jgi:hypothetical protein
MREIAKTFVAVILAAFAMMVVALYAIPARSQEPEQCGTIAAVRTAVAGNGGVEVAYLDGDRARALFVATGAPERAASAGLFAPAKDSPVVMVVLFDGRGCAFAQGAFDRAAIAAVLEPSPSPPRGGDAI